MMAVDPGPGSALRTKPTITTGRAPRCPLTDPGPGAITAHAPRSAPRTIAPLTIATGASSRGAPAANIRRMAALRHPSGAITAIESEPANAAPHPKANPPHMKDAHRPEREPARRVTAVAARP